MCNYTIAFSPLPAYLGNWGDFVALYRWLGNCFAEFKGNDDDDNRGSGR